MRATVILVSIFIVASLHQFAWATVATSAPTTAPAKYDCPRALLAPVIDGKLNDEAWAEAPWTTPFVDLAGRADHPPLFATRCKLLWDDEGLYLAAEISENDVRAEMTRHDAPLFRENALEIFIDPDDDGKNYCELQINALNTTCDLKLTRPYREKGKADSAWEVAGMRSQVHVNGTINDASDSDVGWSVEIAIPWKALATLSPATTESWLGRSLRVNIVRVYHRRGDTETGAEKNGETAAEHQPEYWGWSVAGEINTHVPATWGTLRLLSPQD